MLTQKDFDQIEEIIDLKLEEKLNEKLGDLPSKDDFYEKMDEVMGEIKAMREEQTLIGNKLSDHSDQLEDHEQRISRFEKTPATA